MATILESVQGTTIPQAAAIYDTGGHKWTVVGGVISRDGVKTVSSNVTLVLYFNHVVYQQNNVKDWYWWDDKITAGNPWQKATADPRTIPAPTPVPKLNIGQTSIDLYMDGKLVNQGKIVSRS